MATLRIDKDLEDIFPRFLEHRRQDVRDLNEAIVQKNYQQIETIGHRLMGNAPSYGVGDLGPIGEKLEAAAKSKNDQSIIELTREYSSFMDTIKVEFV